VAEAGWQTWSASISADQRDLTLSGAGPLVALGVAWRPSARPAGVE
jgi:hypothetical protein